MICELIWIYCSPFFFPPLADMNDIISVWQMDIMFFFFFPFQFHYSFWIIPLYSVHIFNLISKRLWIFHSNIIQYRLRCNPRHGRKSIWVFSRANTRGHLWCLWINIWREQFCNAMWLSLRHPLKCVHIYIHKYI